MNIDWTKPVITDEDPPRPVRVLATDLLGPYPIAIHIAMAAGVYMLAPFTADGRNPYSSVRLRNVTEAKPEPVSTAVPSKTCDVCSNLTDGGCSYHDPGLCYATHYSSWQHRDPEPCPNCFEGKSDMDHICRVCGGTGKKEKTDA